MTKYLARILEVDEALFAKQIAMLEHASAQGGIDISLTTRIRAGVREKMRQLDLDPTDTTASELYHALQSYAQISEHALRLKLKLSDGSSSEEILNAVARHFTKQASTRSVWSIKRSSLKKVFKEVPPLRTMKALHYRSMVSLLKRESVTEIYALVNLIEAESYKQKLMASIKKLKPSDFESHPLEIVTIDEKRWKSIAKNVKTRTIPVFSLPETSTLVVIPVSIKKTTSLALLASSLLLKEVQHCVEHAAYLKLKTLDPKLHHHIEVIAMQGRVPLFTFHDQQVYWHHMHHVLSHRSELPDHLMTHMAKSDLEWIRIEVQLASLAPELEFWLDTHNLVFVSEDHVVSLHVIDVCLAALYSTPIETASIRFARDVVLDELIEAYLQSAPFSRILDDFSYKLTDIGAEMMYA